MDNEIELVQSSGLVGGRAGRNFLQTPWPVVKAWTTPLKPGAQGYEFYTPIAPKPFGGNWVGWWDQAGVTAGTIQGEEVNLNLDR